MNKNIPKLRFPKFEDAQEWKVEKIGSFLRESRILGNNGDIAKKIIVKCNGEGAIKNDTPKKGSVNTKYYRRKTGQFIYGTMSFENQAFAIIPQSLNDFESTIALPCFDFNDGLNPIFLLEYVKRKHFYKKYGSLSTGVVMQRIIPSVFLGFPILKPKLQEQEKIANCLSSINDIIKYKQQRLEHLQDHKEALIQMLFASE